MSKPLNPRQLKAVEMLVLEQKQKQEVAKELGVSNGTISQWVKKPEFEEAMKETMHRAFQPMAYKARDRMNQLIDSGNDQVALAACRDVLDRAGYGATQKIDQTITNKEINIEIGE